MKKRILIGLSLMFMMSYLTAPVFAESRTTDSFQENMERDFVRGFKNVLGAPLEIPITMQEYHESAGPTGFRHIAGFVDGSFQMITRAGSGIWDFIAAFLPGFQEGYPVSPETLF
ncbi:MAG TPA: hypothetical protein VD913_01920 [bacterium]|nr:hypothetical protein [bacterium]